MGALNYAKAWKQVKAVLYTWILGIFHVKILFTSTNFVGSSSI